MNQATMTDHAQSPHKFVGVASLGIKNGEDHNSIEYTARIKNPAIEGLTQMGADHFIETEMYHDGRRILRIDGFASVG